MSHNKSDAKIWLAYGEEDLHSAKALHLSEESPRNVAYLSQQAVEKTIKACYVLRNLPFPRSHNLEYLRTGLEGEWSWKGIAPDLSSLTQNRC